VPSPLADPGSVPRCSIVIPVYNNWLYTSLCLDALARSRATEPTFEVIVVDNGSSPEVRERLAEAGSQVDQLAVNPTNLGFAIASNQGARLARGEYIVFLNNDTIVQEGWLRSLVSAATADPSRGAVGACLLYPDGTIQHAGVSFADDHSPRHTYAGFPGNTVPARQSRSVQALTAACLLVPRSLFEAVGGFDEGYLNSFEDLDLCFKVRAFGRDVYYCADAVVYHFESTTPGRQFRDDRNYARFLERWDHAVVADVLTETQRAEADAASASAERLSTLALGRRAQQLRAENENLKRLLQQRDTLLPGSPALAQALASSPREDDLVYHPARITGTATRSRGRVAVRVENRGTRGWEPGRLNLSYHLRRADESEYVQWDGDRTAIEQSCLPGDSVTVWANVTMPDYRGLYVLEWDAVEEGVAWESSRGVLPFSQWVAAYPRPFSSATVSGLPLVLPTGQEVTVEVALAGDNGGWSAFGSLTALVWLTADGQPVATTARLVEAIASDSPPSSAATRWRVIAPSSTGTYRLIAAVRNYAEDLLLVETLGGTTQVESGAAAAADTPSRNDGVAGEAMSHDDSPIHANGSIIDWQIRAEEMGYALQRLQQTADALARDLDQARRQIGWLEADLAHFKQVIVELLAVQERFQRGRVMRLLTFLAGLRQKLTGWVDRR
jgi:GT2 family glycosyltransferase